jgi:hypothetical protein
MICINIRLLNAQMCACYNIDDDITFGAITRCTDLHIANMQICASRNDKVL